MSTAEQIIPDEQGRTELNPARFEALRNACLMARFVEECRTLTPPASHDALPTAEDVKKQAYIAAMEKTGSVQAAAGLLGVSRGTVYQRLQQMRVSPRNFAKNVIRIAAAFLIICAHLCPSVAQAQPVPKPKLQRALTAAPPATGSIMLTWWASAKSNTVVNLTTATATPALDSSYVTLRGLAAGSTNTIVVTNSAGSSAPVKAVATRGTNRITLAETIQRYTVPLVAGRTNWLLISTNLTTWQRRQNFGTNAGSGSFLVTNKLAAEFYQMSVE